MKNKKIKLTAEQIVEFFTSKPIFDKSQTDASILYGWSSTRGGLYSITDIYKYFEAKGFDDKAVDDVIYKNFQKQTAFQPILGKMEKGKTHNMFLINVYNHNPDYKQNFCYYFYDLTKEEVTKLKLEYEAESLELMQTLIARRKNATKNYSAAKKAKEEKKTTKKVSKPKESSNKTKVTRIRKTPPISSELITIE